ncbi:hypothetical protein [Motiliproteus sp. SC1-56]|uniref:hypothetical protein n=1 Tax=Motiliproteus sp. SC1-56 TaxID=2799565 RepID=UPI001A8F7588|nr:hypothetical protein [Motiliproteus sp. SC1-56]
MIPSYEKITEFWCEVVNTIDRLLEEADESSAHQMLRHYEERLKSIDRNLTFHFERDEQGQRIEMIFGCDGYAQSIAAVLSLVDAAPTIDGVRIKAFNNRHDPLPRSIRVADEDFRMDDIWYSYRLAGGEFHLSVYLQGLDDQEQNPAVEAVMIFLDALIGEFDLMTRVATLSWYERPAEPLDFGLTPLSRLRGEFDQLRPQIDLIGVTLH